MTTVNLMGQVALRGQKVGMTAFFDENGVRVPVTVIQVPESRITQIKTNEKDGYTAIQLTAGEQLPSRLNKAQKGHFGEVAPGRGLWEVRVPAELATHFAVGQVINITDVFAEGMMVDVTANSRGKGFAGGVKRHNFRTQDATHGNSLSHRAIGSTGQNQTPGRVFKGKKMPGRMGNKRCTVLSQPVVRVDSERNVILVRGAVPGAPGGNVLVRLAVKAKSTASAA